MNIEESEITAGDLKQKIRVKKFGNAPEKFELILKDPITKRDYLDTDFIKPKTVVLVLRLPGHKSLNSGLYVQPTEDIVNKKKESAKIGDESERIKDQKEEDWDNLLMKYNVRRGHRLYLFLKDSQFFIIKCANERNLEISQQNEEWATTTFNQDKLDKAYKSCKNVILFFSVNKSTRFQGMAKMISGLTNRVSREWQTEGVRLGYSFKVKWIVTSDMLFANIGTLKALNGESIRKARDTTEIGPDVGIQIALRIDDCRKGDIDLPSTIANNPNFDFTKLSVTDKDFNAQKLLKSEETANSFDLFDDLVKKEDTSAGLPATVEEAKNSAETHLNADEEKKEERPATKMEDLKNAVPSMLPSDRTIGLPKVWEYLKYPGGYPPWFTAYLYPRKHGRSPKNRDHSSRSHHRKSRSRSRSREGSGSRHHEAVSYTHLTLPTNREV
eukprot:TRINITY_DN10023_c0_g2_i2.p1 TRINITY_DN10023_c0_g2~~TRINITY_DN10023_c0_g2_i2.p1  ORF type:complete len:442 (-),score=141.18 TRINITY_DN10023_c0_g2_i2:18-1343(-)